MASRTPWDHYYRRVFADAVRCVEAAAAFDGVDAWADRGQRREPGRRAQFGRRGPRPGAIVATAPDVPFLCDIERAVGLVDTDPYAEVARYLAVHRDQVSTALATLRYVDVARLGRRATAPALFSVALMDDVCPPSTVFAAYHAYGGPAEIAEYVYNDHDGGGPDLRRAQAGLAGDAPPRVWKAG